MGEIEDIQWGNNILTYACLVVKFTNYIQPIVGISDR